MDVLSTTDGSAQAVRDAASASDAIDNRLALERELDRLNSALSSHALAAVQHLNWTLLAQAFLLTSYLIVLVGGWHRPLPGKRWLLGAIAGYGALSLVLGYLSQRGSRGRVRPLRQGRRLVEEALERVANRPPVFSRERWLASTLAEVATRVLPLTILAGWGALALYTLALPLPVDARTAAGRGEPRASAAATPAAVTAPTAATAAPKKAGARRADEVAAPAAAAPAAETPSTDAEAGIAGFIRRAINAPPAEPQEDRVKP